MRKSLTPNFILKLLKLNLLHQINTEFWVFQKNERFFLLMGKKLQTNSLVQVFLLKLFKSSFSSIFSREFKISVRLVLHRMLHEALLFLESIFLSAFQYYLFFISLFKSKLIRSIITWWALFAWVTISKCIWFLIDNFTSLHYVHVYLIWLTLRVNARILFAQFVKSALRVICSCFCTY